MSKIIVVGNSHVAAIKHAWNALPTSERRHDVRFFAAHGPHFGKLALTPALQFGLTRRRAIAEPDVAKRVREINGAPRIDLSRADLVVWAGYLWPLTPLARLMAQFDVDGLREAGSACRLSREAFDAICADFAGSRIPRERWRNWTGPKLILHMRPLPVEDCLEATNPVYSPWQRIVPAPTGAQAVLNAFLDCFEATVAPLGIEVLRQPAESQSPSGLTKREYSREFPGKPREYNHMNPRYGTLSLAAILARADALRAGAAAPGRQVAAMAGSAVW